jgi:hypothetical protein
MARKPKDPALKMNTHLRIPVTDSQYQLIMAAVADEQAGFAAWGRTVLLEAAKKKIEKQSKK